MRLALLIALSADRHTARALGDPMPYDAALKALREITPETAPAPIVQVWAGGPAKEKLFRGVPEIDLKRSQKVAAAKKKAAADAKARSAKPDAKALADAKAALTDLEARFAADPTNEELGKQVDEAREALAALSE